MRAIIIRGYGGPDVLELADVPTPQPSSGQVRIRVHAAPVHPVDIATRAGRLAEHGLMAASGDVGMGWDLAGVVDALGPGVNQFKAGDTVIGIRDLLTAQAGAQAEQVILDTNAVAPARNWSVSSAPTSSSPAPRTWAERSAGSCPAGCTVRSTPDSPACPPWMPSGTRAPSWPSRPAPGPSPSAARACTTSGFTPTGRGWLSSPPSSTPAS